MTSKLIGKGTFTKAYLLDSGRVMLKSCDPIKESMAFGWFPSSTLFPELTRVDCGVYEMAYYPRVASLKDALDPDQWAIYKMLNALYRTAELPIRLADTYSYWYQRFESELPAALAEIMCEALDGCANTGSEVSFEATPRNVAAHEGNLVLLDVFFNRKNLKEARGK